MRPRTSLLLVCACLLAWAGTATFASAAPRAVAQAARPAIDIVEVPGVLDPPLVNYLTEQIDDANRKKASLLVIQLDSAGALDVPLHALLHRIANSRVPIVAYVGPRNAQAASGAALVVAASHIPAMASAATIGPIHPSDLTLPSGGEGGARLREETSEHLAELANGPAAAAILLTRMSARDALEAGVVRYATPALSELLKQLDGQTVKTVAGEITLSLASDEALVRFHKPGPWRRALHTLSSSALVYLLLLAGIGLIVFEVFQPGFGVAGVTGALILAGAGYGLLVLPVAWWALGVALAGLGLLTLDVKLDRLSLASWGGLVALTAGSLFMFPVAGLRPPVWLPFIGALTAFIFFVPAMTVVRRAQHPISRDVSRALVGEQGEVRSMLNPEGFVWVSGALWRARSEDGTRLRVGESVQVTGLENEVLMVRRPA